MKTRTAILITLLTILVFSVIGFSISFLLFKNTSSIHSDNNQGIVLVDSDGNYIYEDKYIKFKFSKAFEYTLKNSEDSELTVFKNSELVVLEKEVSNEACTYKHNIAINYAVDNNETEAIDFFYNHKKPINADIEKTLFKNLKIDNDYRDVKITYFKYDNLGIIEYSFFNKNVIVSIWIYDIYDGKFKILSGAYPFPIEGIDYILNNFHFKN